MDDEEFDPDAPVPEEQSPAARINAARSRANRESSSVAMLQALGIPPTDWRVDQLARTVH